MEMGRRQRPPKVTNIFASPGMTFVLSAFDSPLFVNETAKSGGFV
jgi:hypothetical protein